MVVTGHSRGARTRPGPWEAPPSTWTEIQAQCDAGDEFDRPCTAEQVALFNDGFRDTRVVAGIPTAGNGHRDLFDGVEGQLDVGVPMFFITASNDRGDKAEFFASYQGRVDLSWVELDGGCHEVFNLSCANEDDEVLHPLFATYALAVARRYVLDDASVAGIVDGSVELSPRATFMR